MLADYRSLASELDAYRAGTGGRLRLGIIPFVSGPLIESLIAELTGERQRMSVTVTEAPTTTLLEELRLQNLDAVIGRCSTAPLPPGLAQEPLIRQEGCLLVHAQNPLVRSERVRLADLGAFAWLLPPEGTPTRAAINAVFAKAMLPPPVATVEASSTKIIHLTLRANPAHAEHRSLRRRARHTEAGRRAAPSVSGSARHAAGGTHFSGAASRHARRAQSPQHVARNRAPPGRGMIALQSSRPP